MVLDSKAVHFCIFFLHLEFWNFNLQNEPKSVSNTFVIFEFRMQAVFAIYAYASKLSIYICNVSNPLFATDQSEAKKHYREGGGGGKLEFI